MLSASANIFLWLGSATWTIFSFHVTRNAVQQRRRFIPPSRTCICKETNMYTKQLTTFSLTVGKRNKFVWYLEFIFLLSSLKPRWANTYVCSATSKPVKLMSFQSNRRPPPTSLYPSEQWANNEIPPLNSKNRAYVPMHYISFGQVLVQCSRVDFICRLWNFLTKLKLTNCEFLKV
jgi:hypothetical protein